MAADKFFTTMLLLLLLCMWKTDGFWIPSRTRHVTSLVVATSKSDEFWEQQKDLAAEMSSSSTKSLRKAQLEKFEKRRLALVQDTAYFSVFIFCFLWIVSFNPATAASFGLGTSLGLAYAYGLGKSVEQLGAMPTEDLGGSGIGEARFAFLILLFVLVGKFRSEELQEIPAIGGFFTYQLASLKQGLQEIND